MPWAGDLLPRPAGFALDAGLLATFAAGLLLALGAVLGAALLALGAVLGAGLALALALGLLLAALAGFAAAAADALADGVLLRDGFAVPMAEAPVVMPPF